MTDRTKHTPGPWRVENSLKNGFEVWAPIDGGSMRVAVTGHAYTFDKANAGLIAAAPEMLAALRLAYPLLTEKAAREEIGALLLSIDSYAI